MHLDSEGNPTNLTELDIRMENGIFKAEATGAGSVEKAAKLYLLLPEAIR